MNHQKRELAMPNTAPKEDLFDGDFQLDDSVLEAAELKAAQVAERPPEVVEQPGDNDCTSGACAI
jgi:hypothetical protein